MTANIDPLKQAPVGSTGAAAKLSAPTKQASGAFAAALDTAQRAGATEAVPPSPPPELAERIASAARAWEALAASGRHVSFTQAPGGRTQIELAGDDGSAAASLTGSQLFDLIDREGAL